MFLVLFIVFWRAGLSRQEDALSPLEIKERCRSLPEQDMKQDTSEGHLSGFGHSCSKSRNTVTPEFLKPGLVM